MLSRTTAALGLLAGLGLTPVSAPAADDAKPFVSEAGRYKIQFPGEPKTTRSNSGGTTVHTTSASPRPGVSYTVVYFDQAAEIAADQVAEQFKKLETGIKGKVDAAKDLAIGKNKLPGREVVFTLGKVVIRQLMVIDGKRMYLVLVGGPTKEVVTSPEAEKFFKSLEVTR